MNCLTISATNAGGIVYLPSTNVTVGTDAVNVSLGWRRIQPVGYITVRMSTQIPSDATTTLPVTLTLNGITRPLTLANGDAVTVADILNASVFLVFNNKYDNLLVLMSRTIV